MEGSRVRIDPERHVNFAVSESTLDNVPQLTPWWVLRFAGLLHAQASAEGWLRGLPFPGTHLGEQLIKLRFDLR